MPPVPKYSDAERLWDGCRHATGASRMGQGTCACALAVGRSCRRGAAERACLFVAQCSARGLRYRVGRVDGRRRGRRAVLLGRCRCAVALRQKSVVLCHSLMPHACHMENQCVQAQAGWEHATGTGRCSLNYMLQNLHYVSYRAKLPSTLVQNQASMCVNIHHHQVILCARKFRLNPKTVR